MRASKLMNTSRWAVPLRKSPSFHPIARRAATFAPSNLLQRHFSTAEAIQTTEQAVKYPTDTWLNSKRAVLRLNSASDNPTTSISSASMLDHAWLRDICPCPKCVDTSTRQKLFQTSDIPSNIEATDVETLPDGSLQVKWINDTPGYGDDHISVYPESLLDVYRTEQSASADRFPLPIEQPWNKAQMDREIQFIDYKDYMSSDETVLKAVEQLSLYGLVFIRGAPSAETEVEAIANRVANLRETFYGRTWDVKSVPQAKNIAYTNVFLGFHMDLLYMSDPPGIQLLHCIKNSCEGGASMFSDAFLAAETLREKEPQHFTTLVQHLTTYHYRNANQHYLYKRPTIQLEEGPEDPLERRTAFINWSPPFQGPFNYQSEMGPDDGVALRKYIAAANAFSTIVEKPENIYEYKMKEGDCVIFNNRRVLHARRAFDTSSGERWLKGAYFDTDAFKSRYRVLKERFSN